MDPATGDLAVSGGEVSLLRGRDAIKQHLEIRLSIALGEWYQDERVGIPLYEQILVSGADVPTILAIYRRAVATTAGIVSIERFDHTFDAVKRELSISGEAITVDDEVVVFGHTEFLG